MASEMILCRSPISLIPIFLITQLKKLEEQKSGEEKGFFQINGKQKGFPKSSKEIHHLSRKVVLV